MNEMRLTARVSLTRVSMPLNRPLSFLPADGTMREIAIVTIRDENGAPYYGEIAPLPGHNVETLDDAIDELDTLASSIPSLQGEVVPVSPIWSHLLRTVHCPSLRCGLEGALLDYGATTGGLTKGGIKHPTVACNALVMSGDEEQLRCEIAQRVALGFQTIKIKISPRSIEDTLRALQGAIIPAGVRLRLDANRSFSPSEWSAIAPHLKTLPIEYVEEPVNDISKLPAIVSAGSLPIAIDETTRDTAPEEWLLWGVRAAVIKPSINGGLLSLLPLISHIERHGSYVTLSSSFESGVGLRAIALFASLLERCGAIGVDTASWMEGDLLTPSFPRSTPNLVIHDLLTMRYNGGA
jgi:o-succinylbenzoate synthase